MHTLLVYLTDVVKIDRSIITDGFYASTDNSPQEYLCNKVGPLEFRTMFADWAAHHTASMDYISREQWERALLEISLAGDWSIYRPSVWSGQDQGTPWEDVCSELIYSRLQSDYQHLFRPQGNPWEGVCSELF